MLRVIMSMIALAFAQRAWLLMKYLWNSYNRTKALLHFELESAIHKKTALALG